MPMLELLKLHSPPSLSINHRPYSYLTLHSMVLSELFAQAQRATMSQLNLTPRKTLHILIAATGSLKILREIAQEHVIILKYGEQTHLLTMKMVWLTGSVLLVRMVFNLK